MARPSGGLAVLAGIGLAIGVCAWPEETGRVAITQGGRMLSRVEQDRLRALLESFYAPQSPTTLNVFNRTWLRVQSLLRRPGKAAA